MSRRAETAPVTHICDYADVIGDQHLITATVGQDLSPVLLALKQPPDYRVTKSSGASFSKRQARKPNNFSVHYFVDEDWHTVELEATSNNFHCVQPLGNDKWLLVRGRASGPKDKNACVYDMQGQRLWSFHAGDGIEDVQATEAETIWVSYFDEGVYSGNDLGSAGLIRFSERGEVLFRYDSLYAPHNVPVIDDCYALNVCSSKETWLYYYSDFSLVKLVDGKVEKSLHKMPVSGAHAFAVGSERVLFSGSYNKRKSLFLMDLASKRAKELRPVSQENRSIGSFRGFARRSRLYLATEESLFCLDLENL